MAYYNFTTFTGNAKTFPAFLPTDIINFNSDNVNAGQAVFSVNATGDAVMTIAGKALTFTGLTIDNLTTANFTFSNGGQVLIGDIKDNSINNSVLSDYIDGRAGNDTVSYDSAIAAVTVNLATATAQNTLGSGIDTLANIENLRGSQFNDTLIGNALANTLDGGLGIDVLIGGDGNDNYLVDNPLDQVLEAAAGGTDTVSSTVDYILAGNVENLILLSNATNAIGNASNNIITGNTRNNILNGGTGQDTMIGLGGDDIYIVDNANDKADETSVGSSGIDTVLTLVNYTLGNNVENLKLIGVTNLNGTGNVADNVIFVNYGNNTIDGVSGNDTVSYQFGSTRGVTVNLSLATPQNTLGSGTDTFINIDNLVGSTFNDTLTGDVNANKIEGGLGNDLLNGGGGNDTLSGGFGDDTYIVTSTTGYTIVETGGQGTDTINTDISYNLSAYSSLANIENLTLTGTNAVNGTGNAANNTLIGNSASNILTGQNGNDILDGGAGSDILLGGAGNDTYTIDDLADSIIENASEGSDTINASITYTVSANVENLTLTGAAAINGTGNADANTITGNAANNVLSGGDGADKLFGGLGNDTLDGGAGVDTLTGGDGNDSYYIDTPSDSVVENTKIVAGATVQEGTDTIFSAVTYKIASANVENLTLTGTTNINATGTDLNNVVIGNAGNNILSGAGGNDTINAGDGKDTLDGGKGVDTMRGNLGDDLYIIDDVGDRAIEAASEGFDTVQSSVSFTLGVNVEVLTLTATTVINGTGNAGNNTLTGNSANNVLSGLDGDDILDGGAGTDKLTGGNGNDIFKFTAVGDTKVAAPDIITDFTGGSDKMNFANLHTAAVPLILLADKGADFTHTPGEIKFAASGSISADTTVSVDLNGDATADFSVLLTGYSTNLTITDFIV
jgi:Ca2+-binding RTX toxin-like protein